MGNQAFSSWQGTVRCWGCHLVEGHSAHVGRNGARLQDSGVGRRVLDEDLLAGVRSVVGDDEVLDLLGLLDDSDLAVWSLDVLRLRRKLLVDRLRRYVAGHELSWILDLDGDLTASDLRPFSKIFSLQLLDQASFDLIGHNFLALNHLYWRRNFLSPLSLNHHNLFPPLHHRLRLTILQMFLRLIDLLKHLNRLLINRLTLNLFLTVQVIPLDHTHQS